MRERKEKRKRKENIRNHNIHKNKMHYGLKQNLVQSINIRDAKNDANDQPQPRDMTDMFIYINSVQKRMI